MLLPRRSGKAGPVQQFRCQDCKIIPDQAGKEGGENVPQAAPPLPYRYKTGTDGLPGPPLTRRKG